MEAAFDWTSWHTDLRNALGLDENVKTEVEVEQTTDIKSLSRVIYRTHLHKQSVPSAELSLLLHQLKKDEGLCAEFREFGGIHLILHVLSDENTSHESCATCCQIIATVVCLGDDFPDVVGHDVVTLILIMMKEHKNDISVLLTSIGALRRLCLVEANRTIMLKNAVLELISDVLKHNTNDEDVAESAVALVALIVYGNTDARTAFGSIGGIPLVVSCMAAHRSSDLLQWHAAMALRNLAFQCPANIRHMRDSNALEYLFNALSVPADFQDVQQEALAALGNMCANDEECRQLILSREDYIERLFQILYSLSTTGGACEADCALLRLLCGGRSPCSKPSIEKISSICMQNSGLEQFAALLSRVVFQKHTQLIGALSDLLSTLCIAEELQRIAGGTKILSTYLQWIVENVKEREAILSVLHSICALIAGNDDNKLLFGKSGGFAAIEIVFEECFGEEGIVEEGCKVLDLATNGQNVTTSKLVNDPESVARMVQTAMMTFPSSSILQECGLSILIKIAGIGIEQAAMLNRLHVGDTVSTTKSSHTGNPVIESRGSQLITLLRGARLGRNKSRGREGSARFRPRCRTIGNRTGSRNSRSESPHRARIFDIGRQAMETAQGIEGKKVILDRSKSSSSNRVQVRKATRMNISLEPVYE